MANALMLESMLQGQPVQAPAALVREYPEALGPYARPVEQEAPRSFEEEGPREHA